MKLFKKSLTNRSLPYLVLIIAALLFACRGPVVKENENNASASFGSSSNIRAEKYVIDKYESIVTWKCSMVLADKGGHDGYVSLSKGELMIEKGKLVGGVVEVDMNTIADEFHRDNNNLINHLKGSDFFDVQKFPISTFVLTKVEQADGSTINVTGNLTIKGITREVTFPVKAEVKGQTVTASGNVTIDRTQWDVRYRSGKFFDDLADKAISDDIEFDLKIVARK